MKLFTKNTIRNLALSALSAAVLSACGGAGSCTSCNPPPSGNLTLSISAPSQYPAGLPTPIEASLTMTNTSSIDASNLVYSIPAPNQAGNYTGVVITPNAGIGSQSGACTNIAAGASCTFSASIAAYANPGSFTVTATPDGSATQSAKAIQTGKSLQAGSISVTANLGLVDVPNTQNEYYVLPSDQTVQGSTGSPSTVYVSVWVKTAGEGLNSLKLVDETGRDLTYVAVGTPSYAVNSVNSYKVTIPAGKTVQHIQALSNVCTTLNNGDNNNTACSNDADVNLAQSGVGILAIQPNYFQMSTSHESQVVTLQNIGTANITAMQMPVIAAPFKVLANTCTGITTLAPAASCTVTIGYTPASSSGQGSYVVNYNNGTSTVNTSATIPYTGTSPAEVGILTAAPVSVSLTGNNAEQLISLTNTSNSGVVSNLVLPTLSSPLELKSPSSCVNGLTLAAGVSCTYRIGYSATVHSGNFALAFGYNNGQQDQTTNVALDWASTPVTIAVQLSKESTSFVPFESLNVAKSFYAIFTKTGAADFTGEVTATFESQVFSCNIPAGGSSCYIALNSGGTGGFKPVLFGQTSGGVVPSPSSGVVSVSGIWAYVLGASTADRFNPGASGLIRAYPFNVLTGQIESTNSITTVIEAGAKVGAVNVSGKYLYVPVRYNGYWMYAFEINPITGALTELQRINAGSSVQALRSESTLLVSATGEAYSYKIDSSTGLLIPNSRLNLSMCDYFYSMVISPNSKNVYIDCASISYPNIYSKILKFNLDQASSGLSNQVVYNLPNSTFAGGPEWPQGLMVSSDNNYLYQLAINGATPSGAGLFKLNISESGVLSNRTQVTTLYSGDSKYLVPSPDYRYMFYANTGAVSPFAGSISGFNIEVPASPVVLSSDYPLGSAGSPSYSTFDPSGKYYYVTSNTGNKTIFQYSYESATGKLTPLATPTLDTLFGEELSGVVFSGTGNY